MHRRQRRSRPLFGSGDLLSIYATGNSVDRRGLSKQASTRTKRPRAPQGACHETDSPCSSRHHRFRRRIGRPASCRPRPQARTTCRRSALRRRLSRPSTTQACSQCTFTWLGGVMGEGSGPARQGFYPELGGMIPGAGWLSVGPGYRHQLFGGSAVLDMSAAMSWRRYAMMQSRIEWPALLSDHPQLAPEPSTKTSLGSTFTGSGLTPITTPGPITA